MTGLFQLQMQVAKTYTAHGLVRRGRPAAKFDHSLSEYMV